MIVTGISNGIAIIEMSDCSLLTRYDPVKGRALTDAVRDLDDNDEVRALVLCATGRDFCPEIDVLPADTRGAERQAVYASASGLYQSICYCKKVVIAAVQGACAGAGSALVLCADLAVTSSNASIKSPFSLIPEASFTLAALTMRLSRAKAWLLSEEAMNALDAASVGLVNRVVPEDRLRAEALELAKAAALMPMDGMAISKVMMESYLDSQSVGREFDQAGFYAASMPGGRACTSRGGRR